MNRPLFYLTQSVWRQMWRYRLRSILVIFCAALGVAGAITAVNYASSGRQQVLAQINRLGTNIITVSAKQSRAVAGRESTGTIVTTLVEADKRALHQALPSSLTSSAMVSAPLRLKAGYLSKVAPVIGVETDYFAMKSWGIEQGLFFDSNHIRRSSRVALLGYTVARDLFEDNNPLGQRLFINRIPFEIIGVLQERGSNLDSTDEDGQVYVPLTAAMRRLLNVDYYNAIFFNIADLAAMSDTEKSITQLLRIRHRISPLRPDDFQVQSQRELIDTQISAANRLGFLVRWIGFCALLVSGLGIMAIAWIAVRDRTTEVGTRRALGATAQQVFFQFALEAGLLAIIGVLLGLFIGWWASQVIADAAGLNFIFDSVNASLAVIVAVVFNLLFASWPALRAARLDPINALNHE